jgi:RHS repeat-associated protein
MGTTTNFLYDGENAVQEFGTNPTANLLTGGVDERFLRASATETDNYLTDALGSTMELTDSTGATEEQYSYGPYGMLSASGGSTTNSYAYTGREFDGLGINYNRARYYSPATGRFLSEDPLGFLGGGSNLYWYASNNPISIRDPFGLCSTLPPLPPLPDPIAGYAKCIAQVKAEANQYSLIIMMAQAVSFGNLLAACALTGPEAGLCVMIVGLVSLLVAIVAFSARQDFIYEGETNCMKKE